MFNIKFKTQAGTHHYQAYKVFQRCFSKDKNMFNFTARPSQFTDEEKIQLIFLDDHLAFWSC